MTVYTLKVHAPEDGPCEVELTADAPYIAIGTRKALDIGARRIVVYAQVEDVHLRAALEAAGYHGQHQKQPGLMAFERMAGWEYPR